MVVHHRDAKGNLSKLLLLDPPYEPIVGGIKVS